MTPERQNLENYHRRQIVANRWIAALIALLILAAFAIGYLQTAAFFQP